MVGKHINNTIDNEQRREFLKALGVAGTVTATGMTLDGVREAMSTAGAAEQAGVLAESGATIRSETVGSLDSELLATQSEALAAEAATLPSVAERGFPSEPRDDFGAVAAAGRPVYDHLEETGFFEVSSEALPEFTPEYLTSAVETFVASSTLAEPLEALGLTDGAGADLVSTVVTNAADLEDFNWVATEEFSHETLEEVAAVPPVTMAASGGALLWLEDLDDHIWRRQVILTDEILNDAVWHGQSMAAGFYLLTKAAEAATVDSALSDAELAALASTGVAVQEIAQSLLPTDVYWVTEEMRDSRRTDLRTVTR